SDVCCSDLERHQPEGAPVTATGTGPQAALAAPPATPPTGEQPAVEETERRRQLLLALTTEHLTLQPPARPPSPTATAARRCIWPPSPAPWSPWLSSASWPTPARRSCCSPWPCCPPWCCWAPSPTCGW